MKEKMKNAQIEIERRNKIFEKTKANNLAEQIRLREIQFATRFKLNTVEDLAGYMSYDVDTNINFVAEKAVHQMDKTPPTITITQNVQNMQKHPLDQKVYVNNQFPVQQMTSENFPNH